jgi:hypothetical protein
MTAVCIVLAGVCLMIGISGLVVLLRCVFWGSDVDPQLKGRR